MRRPADCPHVEARDLMTLADLTTAYGRRWRISDAVGGGWYAVRIGGLSVVLEERGLVRVIWVETLCELAKRLEEQERLSRRT